MRCRPAGRGGDGAGPARTRRAGGYPGRNRRPARGRRRGTARPWRGDRCGPAGSSNPGRRAPRESAPDPARAGGPSPARSSTAASSIVTDQPNEPRVSRTAVASAAGRQVRRSASRRQSRARRSALATTSSDGTTSGLLSSGGHGGQLGIEAAGQGRGGVGAGQAGVAQGQVARVNPGVGMREPAGGLPVGDACPQAFDDRGGDGCRGRFQPGHGVLRLGERQQQRMRVWVAGGHVARRQRDGGHEPSRIGVGGCHHEHPIAQWLS